MPFIKKNSLYIAWFIALAAMCGSLYFSNVLGYTPCMLCWYQRIAMYPLVVIIGVAIIKHDEKIYRYALPLAIIGALISVYQNLLYYKIVPEALAPCVTGVSCATQYVHLLGFADIPLLSLLSFVAIIIVLFMHRSYAKNAHQ